MIRIPAALLADIEAAALRARPCEACGLLVGSGAGIDAIVETRNLADRADRFLIDPARHLALQRELRGGAARIVGLFHSHPHGPPAPSDADRAGLGEPGRIWTITSVEGGRPETRAFIEEESGFREVGLVAETVAID